MAIRRPKTPKPTLRHVASLEAMLAAGEGTTAALGAQANFLTLRLLDQWMRLGREVTRRESQAHRATRDAIGRLQQDEPLRQSLGTIVDAIEALDEPDAQPVLPRVYALGLLLEQRGLVAEAADVYRTVSRYVDASAHLDLAYDASMRTGYCLRHVGDFEWADQAYANAGTFATRDRDQVRILLSRLGRAKVLWDRGNLPGAEAAITTLLEEAEALASPVVTALLLHDRASLAWTRGERDECIRWIFRAITTTTDDYDRERMLSDLGAYLMQVGAFDAARDTLSVMAERSRNLGTRWVARINLMDLAYRTRNEVVFEQHRRALAVEPLPPVNRVSYLLDVGKGCTVFGRFDEARAALRECVALAAGYGFNRRLIQAEEALKAVDEAARMKVPVVPVEPSATPVDIEVALRDLLSQFTQAT